MIDSAIDGGVSPVSIVWGISRSGTKPRNFSHAAVGAKEPIPSVSKKFTMAPIRSRLALWNGSLGNGGPQQYERIKQDGQRQWHQQCDQHELSPPSGYRQMTYTALRER